MKHDLTNTLNSYQSSPLLILDFRVIAWNIYNAMEKLYGSINAHKEEVKSLDDYFHKKEICQWIKANWAIQLNRGPTMLEERNWTVVVADDNGSVIPYWRKTELAERYGIDYKAGRKPKPDKFLSVAQMGLDYVNNPKSGLHYFSEQGYEADDIAGIFVFAKRVAQSVIKNASKYNLEVTPQIEYIANRPIVLYTVDNDWLQLVGEGVWWCNMGPWAPLIRYHQEAVDYFNRREKLQGSDRITTPQQIVDAKVLRGDKSDSLPPGSPKWAIDLMNPLPKYHLKNHEIIYPKVYSTLLNSRINNRLDHVHNSNQWLLKSGLLH